MRSRLEAACAGWLDRHHLEWTYEPMPFADEHRQWLPDFAIRDMVSAAPGASLYIDVKPEDYYETGLRSQMEVVWASEPNACLAIWGTGHFAGGCGQFPIGIGDGDGSGRWETGFLRRCDDCGTVGLRSDASPACARCGSLDESELAELPLTDWAKGDSELSLVDHLAEEGLLAGILAIEGLAAEVVELLTPADFSAPMHQDTFEAITRMLDRNEPIDPVTVADELRKSGRSDRLPLNLLTERKEPPRPDLIRRYASLIAELGDLRRLRSAGQRIMELASAGATTAEVMAEADSILAHVEAGTNGDGLTMNQALGRLMDDIESRLEDATDGSVVTGFDDLDSRLHGLVPGRLYILGARPAVGKSALAMGIAGHAALHQNVPTLFFSLEMSTTDLTSRVLASEARVPVGRVQAANFSEADWQKMSDAIERLSQSPLTIVDDAGLGLAKLRSIARAHKRRSGLGLIIVDYLQLMAGRRGAENRQVEVAELSRGLKILARDLEVPVLALSQVSRNLEARADKRPVLADLRESGALENDADVVFFIYRDELYNPDSCDRGLAEVILAKNRHGPTGKIQLAYLDHYCRFANLAKA